LTCGHLICGDCWAEVKKCVYPNCKFANPDIKTPNFVLKKKKTPTEYIRTYQFALKRVSHNTLNIKELKGESKVSELMNDYIIQNFISDHKG
jgi:hypothetical protein